MTLTTETAPLPEAARADYQPAAAPSAPAERWSLPTRIAFRFCVVYFSLYILLTQMFSALFVLPFGLSIPPPENAWSVTTSVNWVATKILKFPEPLVLFSGSGDKPVDWAHAVLLLAVAAIVTIVWSLAAARRAAHPTVHKWFRLFLRFGLGTTMLSYGMVKFIPLQMPFPFLTRLLTPYGNFSLMGVLWSKIGASPAYETFTGLMELTCAVLLFIPGLTIVGALMSFITATQIFALNMMYDVPVKLFSLHLMLMSLVLLAPDMRRLFRVMVLRRAVEDAPEPPLARRRGVRRGLAIFQIVFGGWLIVNSYQSAMEAYYGPFGARGPKPAFYGIWTIERMYIDGVERAPLVTDYDRWRRMVIQRENSVSFQRMDDTFQGFAGRGDAAAKTLTLTRGAGDQAVEIGRLTFEQPADDRLIAHGAINGKHLRLETRRFDHTKLQMLNNRFRWVQDYPFNR